MSEKIFFNAHHSPIGAFASFTLGCKGACGGLGLELASPVNQNVYIGLQSVNGDQFEMFPFYGDASNEKKRFDNSGTDDQKKSRIKYFEDAEIRREFHLSSDIWTAKELTCAIYSPVRSIPDPSKASEENLMRALIPAVFVELTIDNSNGDSERRAIFGYQGNDPYSSMRHISCTERGNKISGVGQGRITAVCTAEKNAVSGLAFSIEELAFFKDIDNLSFGLGTTGALIMSAPAGRKISWKMAVCFYRGGIVTTGLEASYLYTNYFHSIEEVASFALNHFDFYKDTALQSDTLIDNSSLPVERKFMMAHSVRSYYGSTQLLSISNKPYWIVNEGEYRMMNTFDLTVDQLFYEMVFNPWTVRNVLDFYTDRYSYNDTVRFSGSDREYPGGISFTHDMGVGNSFSPSGYSVYELSNLDGCFSYMTQEQLVNWILCAGVYVAGTGDQEWLCRNKTTLESCMVSMLNRDHFNPEKRDGIMDLDCSRVQNGSEITTYDNVDTALGSAKRNTYLSVKCWAAYIVLEHLFGSLKNDRLAAQASLQAKLCAETICSFSRNDGTIPALLEKDNQSVLIPIIEGLVFPWFLNKELVEEDGPYSNLILALKKHCQNIFKSDLCHFEDHGWRLSSTSDNSWLSKIYLCQFVAERILGFDIDADADRAHMDWLLDRDNCYYAWSDQMRAGKVCGSRYYPRGVTSILWLEQRA